MPQHAARKAKACAIAGAIVPIPISPTESSLLDISSRSRTKANRNEGTEASALHSGPSGAGCSLTLTSPQQPQQMEQQHGAGACAYSGCSGSPPFAARAAPLVFHAAASSRMVEAGQGGHSFSLSSVCSMLGSILTSSWRQRAAHMPSILASLSSSSAPPARTPMMRSEVSAGARDGRRGQRFGRAAGAPQRPLGAPRFVETLMGLPLEFLGPQATAQQVYRFHQTTNGGFPRPCPGCSSGEFFVPQDEMVKRLEESAKGSERRKRRGRGGAVRDADAALGGGSSTGAGSASSPIAFHSRPVVCEQCQRWFHLGCLGISYVEDVPVRPWFHCSECRQVFVQLEALGRKGDMSHPLGRSGPVTYSLATPADFSHFVAGMAHEAKRALPPAGGSSMPPLPMSVVEGSRIPSVLDLLSQGDFNSKTISGYMDPAAEFDGGRYALVLQQEGVPVCAATFNVFSQDLPAQVNLVATAEGQRGRGHCSSLFEVLGSMLEDLKVGSVIMQPPPGSNAKWAKKLGFTPMHPADVADLHTVMPLAYLDAPVLELEI